MSNMLLQCAVEKWCSAVNTDVLGMVAVRTDIIIPIESSEFFGKCWKTKKISNTRPMRPPPHASSSNKTALTKPVFDQQYCQCVRLARQKSC